MRNKTLQKKLNQKATAITRCRRKRNHKTCVQCDIYKCYDLIEYSEMHDKINVKKTKKS